MFKWIWAKAKGFVGAVDLNLIDDIQRLVVGSCNYVPFASSIAAILAMQLPQLAPAVLATTVAGKICSAVKAARGVQGLTGDAEFVPEVDGVVLDGIDVRPK